MNKTDLLNLANKGEVEIEGIPLEVIIKPSSLDGTDWIEIHVKPFSNLHRPLLLGQKWVEHITDEECAELPSALLKYKKEAEEFCEKAKRIIKAKRNEDITYSFTDVPQSVLDDWQKVLKTSLALNQWKNGRQVIRFVDQKHQEWYAPDIFTLELDGVLYEPHWSYWLERVYYIADDKIRELAQVK